jgi:peptide/nickel transport system permease protein
MAGAAIVAFFVLMATVGPLLVHVSTAPNPADAYALPSWQHPLGTDYAGRDTFAEIVNGSTPVLTVAVLAAFVTVAVGVVVGLTSGLLGGWADQVLMRLVDIVLTLPGLPLIIVLVTFIHSTNPLVLAAILAVTGWAGLSRAVRSQALSLAQREFVEAARVQGLSFANLLFRQLLPNVGPYVAMNFLLNITGAIYAEVGLYLLGVAPISVSNWGVMLNFAMNLAGAIYTPQSMWYLFSPMAAIVLLQIGFVLLTRALDQLFNPRLRTV